MTRPAMLYYGKIHHSHEAMAEAIDAELIQVNAGPPVSRIFDAVTTDLQDRPVITEGGIPLFQAAWMKKLGHAGPLIHLAADEALMNIFTSLDHYGVKDRLAHKWAHRHVDAVMAVSPRLMSEARALGVGTVRLIHPFPDEWKWEALGGVEPDLSSRRVLAVGSNRPKNNFGTLQRIADRMERDVVFDIVGPETDEIPDTADVTAHGFVSKDELVDLFTGSAASVLPAVSQPFPVSTLESLRAGLPPFVSTETGTSAYIQKVDPRLVQGLDAGQFADALDWYFGLGKAGRERVSMSSRSLGARFGPRRGRETFAAAYDQVMGELCR